MSSGLLELSTKLISLEGDAPVQSPTELDVHSLAAFETVAARVEELTIMVITRVAAFRVLAKGRFINPPGKFTVVFRPHVRWRQLPKLEIIVEMNEAEQTAAYSIAVYSPGE
jgi:hypothetical protein